ncbi:MAG: pyrroline-5-carboxylate reductase [Bradyrhizobium sp.]|nr:pyrroline-5-carboxylate reductase [Bradyrhizobium sp.]
MLRGWLAAGIAPSAVSVIDPAPVAELLAFQAETGFGLNQPIVASDGQIVVLAVKPQRVGDLSDTLRALMRPDTLVLSIMAGKTLVNLADLCPGAEAIVRAMPNLPAAVGAGATVGVISAGATVSRCATAERLLGSTGTFEWLDDEALIDAATGLSGSGPAYLFYLADCLAEAGAKAGLPHAVAERLARATVAGAGEMLRQSDKPAAELRRDVTSPAGTTEAGLKVLMGGDTLQDLVTGTVQAAADRARELAG